MGLDGGVGSEFWLMPDAGSTNLKLESIAASVEGLGQVEWESWVSATDRHEWPGVDLNAFALCDLQDVLFKSQQSLVDIAGGDGGGLDVGANGCEFLARADHIGNVALGDGRAGIIRVFAGAKCGLMAYDPYND